jgi:hypothetical protein
MKLGTCLSVAFLIALPAAAADGLDIHCGLLGKHQAVVAQAPDVGAALFNASLSQYERFRLDEQGELLSVQSPSSTYEFHYAAMAPMVPLNKQTQAMTSYAGAKMRITDVEAELNEMSRVESFRIRAEAGHQDHVNYVNMVCFASRKQVGLWVQPGLLFGVGETSREAAEALVRHL